MNPQEFQAAWERILAQLSASDRELVESTLAGAEANHSAVYMIVTFGLGLLGGWLL